MIDLYCNQTATLKTKVSVNEYNEPTYTTSTIKCRYEYKRKMVRNSQGQDIISEATCITKSVVKPDDIITFDSNDWVVLTVSNIVDLFGNVLHYEVNL